MRSVVRRTPLALLVAMVGTVGARRPVPVQPAADSPVLRTAVTLSLVSTPTDACTLLTPDQVGAALGTPVGPGTYRGLGDLSKLFCKWTPPGPRGATELELSVRIIKQLEFDMTRTTARRAKVTPAPGVGDDAYFLTGQGVPTNLRVKKGANYYYVEVDGKGFHDNLSRSMSVLSAIAKELPGG